MHKPDFAMTYVDTTYPWHPRVTTYSVSRKTVADILWNLRKNTRHAAREYPLAAAPGVYLVAEGERVGSSVATPWVDMYFHRATKRHRATVRFLYRRPA